MKPARLLRNALTTRRVPLRQHLHEEEVVDFPAQRVAALIVLPACAVRVELASAGQQGKLPARCAAGREDRHQQKKRVTRSSPAAAQRDIDGEQEIAVRDARKRDQM